MRCWNCKNEVPMSPFCRNCGAALPDPETRRSAITTRLAEISAERIVLEAQLQRLSGGVAASAPAAPRAIDPTSPAAATPVQSTPAPGAIPQTATTATRKPLFHVELSPATVVTLVGVVLLAAASFVSAKENPALISLSHSTRMIVLVVESLLAAVATFYLAADRKTLADAFGALTWSATLSLGLLLTVNISNGTRPDIWTYSLPFIVGILIVVLARRHLELTRFVGVGTVAFGVVHLAHYGLNPNIDGYQYAPEVTMARGVIVMALISLAASGALWTAFSPRLAIITRAERYLAIVTVGLVLLFSVTAPLPRVTSTTSGVLALLGELSIAVPFFVAAIALQRRVESKTASVIFGVAGGWIALGFIAGALLGHADVVTRFPGSRTFTLLFPVIFSGIAIAYALLATKVRSLATPLRLIAITSLIPSLGAVAGTLRWELAGGLGRDGLVPVGQISTLTTGWFGQDVTVGDVWPPTIAFSGLSLVVAAYIASRSRIREPFARALRQIGGLLGVMTALAVAMRFTDPADATVIAAVALVTVGVGAFLFSRFIRESAPLDEWLPFVLLGGGLLASLYRNAAYTGYSTEFQPGGITMAALGVVVVAGVTTAIRRRTTWHAFAGWAVVIPALTGIDAVQDSSQLAWQIGLVTLGSGFLAHGLATRQRGAVTLSASAGLLLGGLYAYVTQIVSMGNLGYDFRIGVVLLALAVSVAVAQRRGAELHAAVAVVPAVVAGLAWGRSLDTFDYPAAWIAGTTALLFVLLVLPRRDTRDSWATFGPPLALSFIVCDYAVLSGPRTAVPALGAFALLAGASVVAALGWRFKKMAAFEIGAASVALGAFASERFSLAFIAVVVTASVGLIVAATQQNFATYRLTERSARVAGAAGIVAFTESLRVALTTHHNDVGLVLSLVALVVLAATRRLGANFESRFVLFAGIAGGVIWARSYEEIAAPGAWLIGGALALLALTWNSDEPEHASWNEWGPSLALTMIPANYGALTGSSLSAAFAIGAAVVLVILGAQLKKRAVFDVAVATFALLSIARLTQVVSDQGRWVVAVIVGVALVGNGFWRETRKKAAGNDDASATSWYRSLS